MVDTADPTTVELFAGIGGFRLAADSLGLKTLWANDISQNASSVYRAQFGAAELVQGDIRELIDSVPRHDFLTAGFPCQPFSSAGKKQGVRDPRGTLFATIAEIVDRAGPRGFVLENVKRMLSMERGSHFLTVLTCLTRLGYDVEWRLMNAMDFGLPQNRQRVLIIGSRSQSQSDMPVIRMAENSEFEGIEPRQLEMLRDWKRWKRLSDHRSKFGRWGLACGNRLFDLDLVRASTSPPPLLTEVLQFDVDPRFDFTADTLKRIDRSVRVDSHVQGVEILYNQNGGARMGYTVFGVNGVAPTLTSTASRHYERYRVGDRYRRLTNVEYARLQGFPDDYCSAVSTYHQYALFGNAVPPPMAQWALERHFTDAAPVCSLPQPAQLSLAS